MSNIDTIKNFVITEFLPGTAAAELAVDHDLLNDGVIDSLGVLKLIAWVEDRFELAVGDADLDPNNFRSVEAIDTFITEARRTASPRTTHHHPDERLDGERPCTTHSPACWSSGPRSAGRPGGPGGTSSATAGQTRARSSPCWPP